MVALLIFAGAEEGEPVAHSDEPAFEEVVKETRAEPGTLDTRGNAHSIITRQELEDRLPRSAPDALRFEPGVFIQQTAHSQGSAYIRGLTGQQTLLLFDGIRLNNTTFRQGPNQYFFTLDAQTIDTIRVVRGGSSTRYGTDALGGVIEAIPTIAPLRGREGFDSNVHLLMRGATADNEFGGRVSTALEMGSNLSVLMGVGWRRVGLLETGGRILDLQQEPYPPVEWGGFQEDGRVQLGTGFNEATADGHIVWSPAPGHTLRLAGYVYDQTDAPRTDQCPPPLQPEECLMYDEQFRSLVYGVYRYQSDHFVENLRATLSWQRQHERRTFHHSSVTGGIQSPIKNVGRDDVESVGLTLHLDAKPIALTDNWSLKFSAGVDTYFDLISSYAWRVYDDADITRQESRGQYVDGAWHLYGGTYLQETLRFKKALFLRAGGRLGWQTIYSPPDSVSDTTGIERQSYPLAGNVGAEWRFMPQVHFIVSFDRSHRSPNMNDLTARQQTGPGFQYENPNLLDEKANTLELGTRLRFLPFILDVFGFYTQIQDAIIKAPKNDDACPNAATGCVSSWNRLQLENAMGTSNMYGAEASLLARFENGVDMRAALSYAFGENPDVLNVNAMVPVSRVPPFHGSGEVHYRFFSRWKVGAAMRWSLAQTRLAPADIHDLNRIPPGGTPGFAVFDLRMSYRAKQQWLASFVLENVFDAAYRYHGSSVNGPGVGGMVIFDLGSIWGT